MEHLASRLQDQAPTDGVVAGANTKRLIEKSIDLEFLDTRRLKGFDDPADIWTVLRVRDVEDRGDEKGVYLEGLLGREAEYDQIKNLWEKAKTGDGQVLVVGGEPGIGKSYLLGAARELAHADGANMLRLFCGQDYENSSLFPLRKQMMRMLGLTDGAEPSDVVLSISKNLGNTDPTTVRLMADLMALNPGVAFPPLDMTATQQKTATFDMVQAHIAGQASDDPLMVLMEDAHWADPTTLELLASIVTQTVPGQPILFVITHRPQVALEWGDLDYVHHTYLDRLSAAESRAVINRVMVGKSPPPEIVLTIQEAADGVPLFLEELSRSVMEQSEQASGSFVGVSVPITLEDSLMARLDRLSSGKDVVQTAAVFGRRFPSPAVQKLLEMEPVIFDTAVSEPMEARILQADTGSSENTMFFRHALVQQAAYEGLARKQRQSLHEKIAALLLEHQPTIVETEPETLARHYAGAGNAVQAITYLIAAGKLATSRAAQVEATNHYLAALDLLDQLPVGRPREETEVALRALLGGALMATRGFAAPEVYDAFARSRELCQVLGDSPIYCSALYGLWTVEASRSNREAAFALADEMMASFAEIPVPSWAIAAHFAKGATCFFAGDLDQAETLFDKAIALYTADQHDMLVEQFADNLAEFSMCYRQWIHLLRGEFDASLAFLQRAEDMANALNNKNAQTRSIAFRMGRDLDLGEVAEVARQAPKLIDISTVQGYPYWTCAGQIGIGWAMASGGDENGLAPIQGSLGFFDMIGQKNPQAYWRTFLIASQSALGQRNAALETAEAALDMARNGLDSVFEALILVRRGEALLTDPADAPAAEADFREALAASQATGAHFYGFQAALALAELLQSQGRGDEEGGVLASLVDQFDGAEFAAMTRARDLVAKL